LTLHPEHLSAGYTESGTLSPATITAFRQEIIASHCANPRPMPWRETGDPYCILISEFMLQQTQVERVKVKYGEFLAEFPTLSALAAAPVAQVLKVWQGLGYNRRALALKRCAEEIMGRFAGEFPTVISDLESLPGIGPYTARAVAAFSFGMAEPLIETNIRTLFIHFFFHNREQVDDREIMPLVAATLDRSDPRRWYYALMDYGALLKQSHANPGRRSAHHLRQSKFEGSNRQLRSRMLRMIMEQPGITVESLAEQLGAAPEGVRRNLEAMQREGFLDQQGGGVAVRG